MTAAPLIAAAIAASPIIKPGMNDTERQNAIRPFLLPAPGQTVSVDPNAVKERRFKNNPMLYKLYITVKPPKGHCFTITRHTDFADSRICKPTRLAVPVGQVAVDGKITWKISTGKGDFGYEYRWNTPHRIAQVIAAGSKRLNLIPIQSCTIHSDTSKRSITLTMMNGGNWTVDFPKVDKLMDQPPPFPNLYIAERAPTGGITEESSLKNRSYNPYDRPVAKPGDPVTAYWTIPVRGSYTMGTSNFRTAATPPGAPGTCRYRFAGAQGDPESGWIECHHADLHDVIFTHLPCAGKLAPPTSN